MHELNNMPFLDRKKTIEDIYYQPAGLNELSKKLGCTATTTLVYLSRLRIPRKGRGNKSKNTTPTLLNTNQ